MNIGKVVSLLNTVMSGFVYILRSVKTGRYYVGSTKNIERRIIEHNSGKTKSLKNIRPLTVVFFKKYETIENARKMEKKLKKMKSRVIIEQIINSKEILTGL